jgi:acyl-CoA synthetase (AMP-forming)/AMP-acid ligase II
MAIAEQIRVVVKSQLALGVPMGKIAESLGIAHSTVREIRSDDRLQPELIAHASKHLANKMLLAANAATDTLLDQADEGKFAEHKPLELAKTIALLTQAAGQYAAQCGNSGSMSELLNAYGMTESSSVSKVTLTERSITLESVQGTPQPVVIQAIAHEDAS